MPDDITSKSAAPRGVKPETALPPSELRLLIKKHEETLAANPTNLAALEGCFTAKCNLGDIAGAQLCLEQSKTASEFHLRAWKALGRVWLKRHEPGRAAQCYQRAGELAPLEIRTKVAEANCLKLSGQADLALAVIDRVLSEAPAHSAALALKAEIFAAREQREEAAELYEKALMSGTLPGSAFFKWVELMIAVDKADALEAKLRELLKRNPDKHQLWAGLAAALLARNAIAEAEVAATKACELAPDKPRYLFDLGSTKRVAGRIEESHKILERGLQLDPLNPMALRIYGVEHKYSYGDDADRRLTKALAHVANLTPKQRANLFYAKAKALEDVGDLEGAFEYYAVGGREKKKDEPYDERRQGYLAKLVMKIFTQDYKERNSNQGFPSRKPVFVLGMPRSGTSLLEQVLASHPEVYGAGEQKLITRLLHGAVLDGRIRLDLELKGYWPLEQSVSMYERGKRYVEEIEKLAGPAPSRVVDKMPGNYTYTGFIFEILPEACIIHSRRHPVETCLSNYRLLFTEGQLWSYNLAELGRAYKRYDALMKHWASLFGDRILDVRYEDMVMDLERQARRIIDYLGLPWNDACLRFYESDKPMRTASASQVRRPIYQTSINRWRKYEPYLKPLLEELGPLVAEYEAELEAPAKAA
jgi:tetratricopeptide (TPR) repeat protein